MPKLTFSLDETAVQLLRTAAERSRKPLSLIVREAITQYAAHEEKLSEDDRQRLLGTLRRIKHRPPTRSQADVDKELKAIRGTRRTGWSRPVR
jgi:hypothetical protein